MSDLIDLKSPERKTVRESKLASPLIPVPTDRRNSNINACSVGITSSLNNENRNSLDNNPFDMVYKKTRDYVRKKDDPFEIVLEKALKSNANKNNASKPFSVRSPRDFTPKRKKVSKLNKTLDDSLLGNDVTVLNCKKETSLKDLNDSIIHDLNDTNLLCEDVKHSHVNATFSEYRQDVQLNSSVNVSILNNTAMNDTLSELSCTPEECRIKSDVDNGQFVKPEIRIMDADNLKCDANHLKIPKLRRSLSQGDKFSPKKYLMWRSQSITESIKPPEQCTTEKTVDSLPSVFFDDSMNKAFVQSQKVNSSAFSIISDISSIRKLSSASTTGCNSFMSYLSDGTMNKGFVNSNSSTKSSIAQTGELQNAVKMQRSLSVSSMPSTAIEMYDLSTKFNILKTKSLSCSTQENDCNSKKNENESVAQESSITQKLIDVDVFVPERSSDKEFSKSDTSDNSVYSVFSNNSEKDKSILQEAMTLAKTFEELAIKSDGSSNSVASTVDLLCDNHPWMSDLLPAFEDEDNVDNLIELPTSPNASGKIGRSSNENKESVSQDLIEAKSEQNLIKDIELELLSPICAEKKTAAATLLLDLEKIVENENNSEAIKLLDQLEKALGIDCKSNAKLLATCLNTDNNVEKEPEKCKLEQHESDSTQEVKQNEDHSINRMQTENSGKTEDASPNSKVRDESVDDDKNSFENTAKESKRVSRKVSLEKKTNLSDDTAKSNEENDNAQLSDYKTDSNVTEIMKCKKRNGSKNDEMVENQSDEKLAVELLVNLGKVLNKQTVEPTAIDVLKNLGKMLNYAMNGSNFNNIRTKDDNHKSLRHSTSKGKSGPDKRASFSALTKSTNRQSLEMSKTKTSEKSFKRSNSISHTTPTKSVPRSPISSKTKNKPQMNEIKKRFSSDPGFVSSVHTAKKVNSTTQLKTKHDSEKVNIIDSVSSVDVQKEKPLAILHTAKNKFKKKIKSDDVTRKGPMKAFLPLGSMQKLEIAERKISSSTDAVTPPKSVQSIPRFTVTSSTPIESNNTSAYKRSPRCKPMASSTPDAGAAKAHSVKIQPAEELKKCEVSCEISPIFTQADVNVSNKSTGSPRIGKSPTLRKQTPVKTQRGDTGQFGRPKYFTSPRSVKKNISQVEIKQYTEPTQIPSWKTQNLKNGSPVKKRRSIPQQSPLKDCNNLPAKDRPFKLISKLQHGGGNNIIEKENSYV